MKLQSFVIATVLHACESLTMTAELDSEMRCYRSFLDILYKDLVTNEDIRRKIRAAVGEYDEILILVRKNGNLGDLITSQGLLA